jgi:4-amino-4-deoxy-L-arabinose transferase-like glycosyltransferase
MPTDKSPHRPHGASSTPPRSTASSIEKYVIEEIELKGEPEVVQPKPRRWPPRWWPQARLASGWAGLWLVLTAATLAARGAWPLDETRALAVAWEMWASGNSLVPTVNGEPVARAPLLYWLIHLGWLAFGAQELWARLVPALFALASLALIAVLARRLWPDNPERAPYAPYLLLGAFSFAFATPVLMPDMLLVTFTLVAMWALLVMWRARDARAWLALGLALGLGLLAHGALALVYVVPIALLAPLWARAPARPRWRHWYADVGKALVLAAATFAAWLVPAALRAGPHYAWVFFGGALREAALEPFAATQPAWWYMFAAPIAFVPWSLLPLPWLRLWRARREPVAAPLAFCLVWSAAPLAILSALEVKQPQFLLPLLPAAALFLSWLLFAPNRDEQENESAVFSGLAIPLIVIGCALAVLPKLPHVEVLPPLLWELSPFVGVGVVLVGVVTALLPPRRVTKRVLDMAAGSVLLAVFVILGVGSQFDVLQRVEPVAAQVALAQQAGRPVAHVGDYHGEYQYAGRLARPLAVIAPAQAAQWPSWHPDGVIVTYSDLWQPAASAGARPLYQGSYRDRLVAVWDSSALATPRERTSETATAPILP